MNSQTIQLLAMVSGTIGSFAATTCLSTLVTRLQKGQQPGMTIPNFVFFIMVLIVSFHFMLKGV